MLSKEYVININPISWKRPGINKKRFYDQQAHEKLATGIYLLQQHGKSPTFTKPLHVEANFYMPIPAHTGKREKTNWCSKFPDLDNLSAFIFDCINDTGVIWKDDKLVVSLISKKVYDKNSPHTYYYYGISMSEANKHTTVKKIKPSKKPSRVDPAMQFSFRTRPVSQALIDHMIEELPMWPFKNPKRNSILEFHLSYGISRAGFRGLLDKYPALKEAHEVALLRLADKLWDGAITKVYDWAPVKFRMRKYDKEFEEDLKFHASLSADAITKANETLNNKNPITVVINRDSVNE
jgi:Holliday junction resolvase RusA-like endonuclease